MFEQTTTYTLGQSYNRFEGGWASSDTDVWLTLPWQGARVVHWDGTGWTLELIGTAAAVGKVWGNERDIWVLGPNGPRTLLPTALLHQRGGGMPTSTRASRRMLGVLRARAPLHLPSDTI